MSQKKDVPATKQDVEEIVGRVVGEIVGDALQLISERFDNVDERLDGHDTQFKSLASTLGEVKDTVDKNQRQQLAVIEHQDEQGERLSRLEKRAA